MKHVNSELLVIGALIAFLQAVTIRFLTDGTGIPYTSMLLCVLLMLIAIWVEVKKRQ